MMTQKQYERIQELHRLKGIECDRALEAIAKDDYPKYLLHETSARSIGKHISRLLDTWYSNKGRK